MNQLERLDLNSFSVLPESEAREVLGGLAEFQDSAGGYSFCNPTTTNTSGGSVSDKDIDDTWS
jgi:hypothetical protein